jgi:hypothetical protein
VLAADINQLENVLQRAAGQTEAGKHAMNIACYANAAQMAMYMQSLSRISTPVSVSIDTVDVAPANCGAPTTGHLTANGFQILSNSTSINVNCGFAGNFTIQF